MKMMDVLYVSDKWTQSKYIKSIILWRRITEAAYLQLCGDINRVNATKNVRVGRRRGKACFPTSPTPYQAGFGCICLFKSREIVLKGPVLNQESSYTRDTHIIVLHSSVASFYLGVISCFLEGLNLWLVFGSVQGYLVLEILAGGEAKPDNALNLSQHSAAVSGYSLVWSCSVPKGVTFSMPSHEGRARSPFSVTP